MNRFFLLVLGLSICTLSFGQTDKANSWKDYKKNAEDLIELRQYAKAAAEYEKAYSLKTQRGDLLESAAENYMLERDFNNASRVYAQIVDDPKYKDARLNYAYSLKQSNRYEDAMLNFASCLDKLDGKNAAKEAQINREIMGCQFALEQEEGFVVKPYGIDIKALNTNVNSPNPDFAPYSFSDTKFYYSSMKDGQAQILVSNWLEGDWAPGEAVKGFKALKNKHLCNAVINADETEMFFTICNEEQAWGGLSSNCDIYRSNYKGKAWGQPKKLNGNVNHAAATNTQPFVINKDGEQQIFFASNRPNGQGGMDLWFASKAIGADEFGEAVNLGPNVNTAGNEITPFFNEIEGALYFSSNGHLNMGGFDVFKTVGAGFSWSAAENLGMPINTGADEKYYAVASNHTEGYFVSNRMYGDKDSGTDDDVFTFNILPPHFFVQGLVTDERDLSIINEGDIYLYELKEKTQDRRLLSVQNIIEGNYNFRLLPNRNYQLSIEADGFGPSLTYLNTNDNNLYVQEKNISINIRDLQEPVASLNEVLPLDTKIETAIPEEVIAVAETVEAPTAPKVEMPTEEIINEVVAEVQETVEAPTAPKVEIPTEEVIKEVVAEVQEAPTAPEIEMPTEEVIKEVIAEVKETKKTLVSESIVEDTPIIKEVERFSFEDSQAMHETVPNNEVVTSIEKAEEVVVTQTETADVPKNIIKIISPVAEVEPSIEKPTFMETVEAVTDNINKVEAPVATQTETFITNTVILESTSTYAAVDNVNNYESNNNFVAKGNATVPSGTGIYNFDENNNTYKKEGTLLTDEVVTYNEPSVSYSEPTVTYAEPTIIYGSTVPAIEVPLDKYDAKTTVSKPTTTVSSSKTTSPNSILQGNTYQVQLIAVEYHNPSHRRYDGIKNLGLTLNTEYIEGKGWTRVLLGSFKSKSEAEAVLENARNSGFKRAFVVKYIDGQRTKRY